MTTPNNAGPSAFPAGNGQGAFARIDTQRRDPALDAVLSKMVKTTDNSSMHHSGTNRALRAPEPTLLQKISDMTTGNINDAESLFQLLPDTELAMQILVSSIISPKDMVATELNFAVDHTQFNSGLSGELLEVVRNHFQSVYKIDELLPTILQDVLFMKGSYPLLVLPETTIDDAINSPLRVAMESLHDDLDPNTHAPKHLGILGNSRISADAASGDTYGLESLSKPFANYQVGMAHYEPKVAKHTRGFDPCVSVVDNLNILKMPILQDKLRQDRLQDVLGLRRQGLKLQRETISTESGRKEEQSLYRTRRYKSMPIAAINAPSNLKRKSVGHPLVMVLPPECVIPVHVPSNPEEHLGYFILLDQQGNPLVKASSQDYYTSMGNNMNQEMVGSLIQRTAVATSGAGLNNQAWSPRQAEIDEMERTYSDLVEAELNSRLRNGVYGTNVKVARPEEVYRIMLARALAKMHTQILYVPGELMTYIAFDYNEYGVGISLLQKSKILAGIRAMLLFANTMASIKNSVGRTLLQIKLDPQDPDPSTTVEFMLHEYAKTRQGAFPLGASNPVDMISFLQNASVEVAVSGNNAYPETALEVEDKQSNRAKPDQELEKSLRDRHIMSMGISPETVDASSGAEFATSVVANNLLLTKRVMMYQRLLVSFLNDFIHMYTLNSGALLDALRKLVEENPDKLSDEQKAAMTEADVQQGKAQEEGTDVSTESESREDDSAGTEQLLMEFIQAVRVSLPAPDTATLDKQMEAYDKYAEALEKALKAYMDPSFLDGSSMGKLSEFMEPAIAAVKAHYLRQWLRNNNVLTELDMLTTFSEEDGPEMELFKLNEIHMDGLRHSLLTYVEALAAAKAKTDPSVPEPSALTGGGADAFGGGDTGGLSDGDVGGGDDGMGGLDDLGADLDAAGGGDDAGTDATADADAGADTVEAGDAPTADTAEAVEAEAGAEAPTEAPDGEARAIAAEPAAAEEEVAEAPATPEKEVSEPKESAEPAVDLDAVAAELDDAGKDDKPAEDKPTDEEALSQAEDELTAADAVPATDKPQGDDLADAEAELDAADAAPAKDEATEHKLTPEEELAKAEAELKAADGTERKSVESYARPEFITFKPMPR